MLTNPISALYHPNNLFFYKEFLLFVNYSTANPSLNLKYIETFSLSEDRPEHWIVCRGLGLNIFVS